MSSDSELSNVAREIERQAGETEALGYEVPFARGVVEEVIGTWRIKLNSAQQQTLTLLEQLANKDQAIALLRHQLAQSEELAQERDELKAWIKAANQFAWAHERDCPRRACEGACTCGLDQFLGRPRPFIESYRQELGDLQKDLERKTNALRRIADWAKEALDEKNDGGLAENETATNENNVAVEGCADWTCPASWTGLGQLPRGGQDGS